MLQLETLNKNNLIALQMINMGSNRNNRGQIMTFNANLSIFPYHIVHSYNLEICIDIRTSTKVLRSVSMVDEHKSCSVRSIWGQVDVILYSDIQQV